MLPSLNAQALLKYHCIKSLILTIVRVRVFRRVCLQLQINCSI